MIKFQLKDGRFVDPVKDCVCTHHDGPHWLHMDKLWKEKVQDYRDNGNHHAALVEGQARIREKLYQMQSQGIERVITLPDPPLDPQPEFVPPPPHTLGYVLKVINEAIEVYGPDVACQLVGCYGATGTMDGDFGTWENESDMVYLYTDLCSG